MVNIQNHTPLIEWKLTTHNEISWETLLRRHYQSFNLFSKEEIDYLVAKYFESVHDRFVIQPR
jgi:hypothetical protein